MSFRPIYPIVLMLIALVPVFGCGAQSSTTELPTLVVIPSAEPTVTPNESPVLTEEVVAKVATTEIPTEEPAASTPTMLPASPTIGVTNTPSNTARPRATATFSITPPATGTATLSISLTPDTPRIVSFTASSSIASAGGQVTLIWDAVGDNPARIDRLNQNGQVVQTLSVTPAGSVPVTIPVNEGSTITYRLAVSRGGQEVTSTLTITVGTASPIGLAPTPAGTGTSAVNCATPWFFGNEFAPADAGCPTGVATEVSGAYQPFQTGHMFLLSSAGSQQNQIYGLLDPANSTQGEMTQALNEWDNQSTYPTYNCGGTPPTGTVEPQQMFAWMYCRTLAPGGPWANAIGFATGSIDTSAHTIQLDASGRIYVDTPAGNVYRLVPVPQGQLTTQWTKIK